MRGFVLRAGLGAALVGCGGPAFTTVPSDGGPAEASIPEASIPEASVPEASIHDASPPDAPIGSTPDAGSSWCATKAPNATFCEDFDEYTDVSQFLQAWGSPSQLGASFSLDTSGTSPSPPNALEVATTALSGVAAIAAREMPAPRPLAVERRLEFDLRIDQATGIDPYAASAFAAILFGPDVQAGAVAISIARSNGNDALAVSYVEPPDAGPFGFKTQTVSSAFPALDTWDGRFALEIDYTPATSLKGPTACVQLYIGVTPQLSPCLSLPADLVAARRVFLALGVYSAGIGNSGHVGLRFDDVTYVER
jgi:hypothetical protein